MRVPYYNNICGVGFGVAVWIKKAIPEPRLAEQQDCSPAFLLHPYAINKREKIVRVKRDKNTITGYRFFVVYMSF